MELLDKIIKDPLLILAGALVLTGAGVLIWGLLKLFAKNPNPEEKPSQAPPEKTPVETLSGSPFPGNPAPPPQNPAPGLDPKAILERFNQLTERLYLLENRLSQSPLSPGGAAAAGSEAEETASRVQVILERLGALEKHIQESDERLKGVLERPAAPAAPFPSNEDPRPNIDPAIVEPLKDKIATFEQYIRRILGELEVQAHAQDVIKEKLEGALQRLTALENEVRGSGKSPEENK